MEFMTGVKEKETLELSELLEEGRLGEEGRRSPRTTFREN